MKLKELKRTVNVCWSPAEHHPIMIAAGSAAQQVDASFSSSSYLELYSLNLEDPGSDMELKSSLQTQQKFQKLVWSGSEIIVGGCDGGLLQFYSSEKLLSNSADCLLGNSTKHNGNVSSLDINPYQKNLLASGASESEIFIWDLNNTGQPMAPGNRSQPYDQVQGLAWNQQVQHILGSTFATRCVVWDLRKNEPIMKLSDGQSRTRWRALAWHPSVATQVCIASEDDQAPVIQLWDLRLASSPLVTLEGHNKGVMSLSWCKQDPDLMLSAGKDGRVLCWNPNNTKPGGELLTEVSQQQQWVFDVSWSPRDPALIACASFEQRVTVLSLLGGTKPDSSPQTQSNIMDSFGGSDSFSQLPAVARAPPPAPAPAHHLPLAPRWLRRTHGAKFSFGGKLVTFDKCAQEADSQKLVYISQVVSEPEIVEKATELDSILAATLSQEPDAAVKLAEYCRQRGDACTEQHERFTWFFLRASFLPDFRIEVLNLLGFKHDEIPSKFKNLTTGDAAPQPDLAGLSRETHTLIERKLANLDIGSNVTNVVIPNGEDTTSLICRALTCGNLEEAVELCLDAKRIADALIIASLGSPELLYKVQRYHLNATSGDPVSLLSHGLLASQWQDLVSSAAVSCWQQTLATLLTHCQGEQLSQYCEMLGDKLSKEPDASLSQAATVCYLSAMSPDAVVARCKPPRDVTSLAHVTSLALLTRRAAEQRGRQIQAGGKLESVLNTYASRLAAQGCLQSALNTLAGVQHAALRDRLTRALSVQDNNKPQQQQQQQQYGNRARTISNQSQPRGQYNNQVYNNQAADPRFEQSWSKPPAPWGAPDPAPPTQPPRPPSVGPHGGLTGRSKYKLDPSVQSSPLYNQYSFNNSNPITSQPQYGYNSPLPDQYQNSSVPNTFAPINPMNPGPNHLNPGLNAVNPALNPLNPGFNPIGPSQNPLNPSLNPVNPGLNPVNPGLNPINPGLNPVNPGLNPMNPGLNPVNPGLSPGVNPAVNGSYYNPQQQVEPATQQQSHRPMQAGWNDPPMLSSNKPKHIDHSEMSALHAGTRRWAHIIDHRRGIEPKQEVQAQAPITHPLFGVEAPQHVPLVPGQGQFQQQYPGQQNPGQQYPGQQYSGQQYPGQQYSGQQFPGQYDQYQQQQYQQGMTQPYQQQTEPPAAAQPPAPVAKPPIPEMHRALQDVFDSLRAQCSEKAINPQMKRKLEDVQRRLESLYDMLREYKLSDAALQTLHSCVQLASSHEHAGALAAATTLASGADFAAAASFLPGLKVLFQLSEQLQVYYTS